MEIRRSPTFHDFFFLKSFRFCSPVLEPYFHLILIEAQRHGKFNPFGGVQVLPLLVLALEHYQLLHRIRSSWLPVRTMSSKEMPLLKVKVQLGDGLGVTSVGGCFGVVRVDDVVWVGELVAAFISLCPVVQRRKSIVLEYCVFGF